MRDHHLAEIITFSSESKSRDNKISLGDQSYHSIGFEIDNTLGRVQTGPIEFSWKRQAFLSWEVLPSQYRFCVLRVKKNLLTILSYFGAEKLNFDNQRQVFMSP